MSKRKINELQCNWTNNYGSCTIRNGKPARADFEFYYVSNKKYLVCKRHTIQTLLELRKIDPIDEQFIRSSYVYLHKHTRKINFLHLDEEQCTQIFKNILAKFFNNKRTICKQLAENQNKIYCGKSIDNLFTLSSSIVLNKKYSLCEKHALKYIGKRLLQNVEDSNELINTYQTLKKQRT